jgi:Uma2 family endonuclease
MTPEEFDAITNYDDRYRYELVRGVLVVSPIPSEAERDPNEELGYLLRDYKKHHPLGSALDKTLAEHEILPGAERRRADRVIWAGLGRVPDPVTDVPTIVIEFVSKTSATGSATTRRSVASTWHSACPSTGSSTASAAR